MLERVGSGEQVTNMGRIERPAEDPKPHEQSGWLRDSSW